MVNFECNVAHPCMEEAVNVNTKDKKKDISKVNSFFNKKIQHYTLLIDSRLIDPLFPFHAVRVKKK